MLSDLVDIRIERGMTQDDVAAILGVTRQRISKIEQYDSNPRLDTIRKYANAVGAIIESRVQIDNWHENQQELTGSNDGFTQAVTITIPTRRSMSASTDGPDATSSARVWSESMHLNSQSARTAFALVA